MYRVIKSMKTFIAPRGDTLSRHDYGRRMGCKMYFMMISIINEFQVDDVFLTNYNYTSSNSDYEMKSKGRFFLYCFCNVFNIAAIMVG